MTSDFSLVVLTNNFAQRYGPAQRQVGSVGSHVQDKIVILDTFMDSDQQQHYETIEGILEFEHSTDFINTRRLNASRTLLHLEPDNHMT